MLDVQISFSKKIDLEYLLELYNDAGWKAYTQDSKKLYRAIENSLFVATLWKDSDLIALIRAVGDGETIIYIQDILVLQKFQKKGLGKKLVSTLLNKYPDVRQFVLLTDDVPESVGFYEKIGFKNVNDIELNSFVRLSNLQE